MFIRLALLLTLIFWSFLIFTLGTLVGFTMKGVSNENQIRKPGHIAVHHRYLDINDYGGTQM